MKSLLSSTMNTRSVTKNLSILRSDAIVEPTNEEIKFLLENKIKTIIDLRSRFETENRPNPLKDDSSFQYYNFPILEGSTIPKSADDFPDLYMTIAGDCQMPSIFHLIASSENGVLFHCTAGKDRTGVVSAILHMLQGWTENEIVDDYMLTKEMIIPMIEKIKSKYPKVDIKLLVPQERHMTTFLSLFQSQYKDAEHYLETIGVSDKDILLLKNKLGV